MAFFVEVGELASNASLKVELRAFAVEPFLVAVGTEAVVHP